MPKIVRIKIKALFGRGHEPTDLSIRGKDEPLSPGYVPATLGSLSLLDVLPYLEELVRTVRARHGRLVPSQDGGSPSNATEPSGSGQKLQTKRNRIERRSVLLFGEY